MAKKRHHDKGSSDPETPDTETPETDEQDETETPETEDHETPPGFEGANRESPSVADHIQNASAQHGSAALPEGAGEYHPNPALEESPQGPDEPRLVQSAPYLDNDTHDFGPSGGEARCRICGKTREELSLRVGRKLTHEELKSAEGSPLLPPRIR
jgi:hypothetical protein